jgi:hypothetical protein
VDVETLAASGGDKDDVMAGYYDPLTGSAGVTGVQPSAISITALGAKPAAISGMDDAGDWMQAPP